MARNRRRGPLASERVEADNPTSVGLSDECTGANARRASSRLAGQGAGELAPRAIRGLRGSHHDGALRPTRRGIHLQQAGAVRQSRIVDEAGSDVPPGSQERCDFRGPAVMQGYRENEHPNQEPIRDAWFRNGDVGLLHDGYLHVIGRVKTIVIVGGSNVYPSDLEAVLDGGAKIREAAVVGRPRRRTRRVARRMPCAPARRSLTAEQVSGLYEHRLLDGCHRAVLIVEHESLG
jgi:acyl-CoA synthetase (AMP-forming)/AMP-acid ligase II